MRKIRNRQEIFEFVKEMYDTDPDYPWKDNNAILRHQNNRKWYGVVLEVEENKLGLSGSDYVDVLNIKSDPLLIGSLLTQPGFYPAYHMNKEQWVSILLDGSVADSQIENLLSMSYKLTESKKGTKKGSGTIKKI